MPFDLEKTRHVFSKTANGRIQQVIAKDKSDSGLIQLIRDHLSEISEEFRQGDFSNPAHIHGEDMPGLAELKTANPDQIKIEYMALPDGAQIKYATKSPQFIKAIHQWFDAQLSDHARHAVPGHPHQHMHHHYHSLIKNKQQRTLKTIQLRFLGSLTFPSFSFFLSPFQLARIIASKPRMISSIKGMKSGINRSIKNSPVTIRKRFLNFSWLAKFRNIAMRARGCIVGENILIKIL